MNADFDEIGLRLFDAALNNLQTWSLSALGDRSVETVEITAGVPVEQIREKWNALVNQAIFYESNSRVLIRREVEEEIKRHVLDYLKNVGIAADTIESLLKSDQNLDLKRVARVLGSSQTGPGGQQQISFSDYSWNREEGSICDALVKVGLAFRGSWSSKKHSYREYSFRSWPFDSAALLRASVMRSLRIDKISGDEWHILSILLLAGNQTVDTQILEKNSDLTSAQLRESLARLNEQGIVRRQGTSVQVSEGLRDPVSAYWASSIYPIKKETSFRQFQQNVGRAVANLEPFLNAKRLLDSHEGQIDDTPVRLKRMPLSTTADFQNQLADMCRLGLAFYYQSEMVVLGDLIRQIEDWLRSSINAKVTFVPANDFPFARAVLRDIFSKCEEYLKLQDGFIGSDTVDMLAYVPEDVTVYILSAIRPAGDEDPIEVSNKIRQFRARRKGSVIVQFIGDSNGAAPFHDRLIITKSGCWQTGTSLKDIGRGKDTTITEIPLSQKKETLEPAFERWWTMKKGDLESKGFRRLDLEVWVADTSHTGAPGE